MNTSRMLGLLFCPIIGLHAASSNNSLPNNICQLYDPDNPTKKTGIITYNENTPSRYKGNKFFGFDSTKFIEFEGNNIKFGNFFNTQINISKISELISGGKVVSPAHRSFWEYYPAMRFLLFKTNEPKSSQKDFLDRQDKKIQKLANLEAVRNFLFKKAVNKPTLIIDLVAWINHTYDEDWEAKLPIKCVSCPNENFQGYKDLTKPELQAWEKEHKKCTIQ